MVFGPYTDEEIQTTTIYLYIFFNYIIIENRRDVELHPERHCPPSDKNRHGQSAQARCPSRSQWPIACYCEEGSITRRLVPELCPRPGGSLILVPASLLGNWVDEWDQLGVAESLGLCLRVQHHDFVDLNLSEEEFDSLRLRMRPDGPRLRKVRSPCSIRAEQYAVLSTVQSYPTQVQKRGGNRRKIGNVFCDCLAWARVIRDESHLTPKLGAQFYRIVESITLNGWDLPNVYPITATPILRNGVSDMLACIKTVNLVSPAISQHPQCRDFADPLTLDQLEADYKRIRAVQKAKGDVDEEEYNRAFTSIGALMAAYCLRRRNESRQNGKTLTVIPPLQCYDVICPTPLEYQHLLESARPFLGSTFRQEDFDAGNQQCVDLQRLLDHANASATLATIPGLVLLKNRRALTANHILQHGWHLNPDKSPVSKLITELLASSGKLQILEQILLNLGLDVDGKPEKLVVVSRKNIVCLAVQAVSHCTKRSDGQATLTTFS